MSEQDSLTPCNGYAVVALLSPWGDDQGDVELVFDEMILLVDAQGHVPHAAIAANAYIHPVEQRR